MKYQNALIAVKDMETSVEFYRKVLGLRVVTDFGANKTLTGGLSLQTLDTWAQFIEKSPSEVSFKHNSIELYFEEDDMDAFLIKLASFNEIEYVHPTKEHAWGQRTVRFYDADGYIIEVGENMKAVTKRFLDSGMTPEEIARRMDVELKYVNAMLR